MNKKNIISAMLLMCLILMVSGKMLYAKDMDLFDEIITVTDSTVSEYGVRASFTADSMEKETLVDIFKAMGYYGDKVEITTIEGMCSIDFQFGEVYGFLEAVKEDKTYITIDIKEKGSVNNINKIKSIIADAVGEKYGSIEYYQYLKARLKDKDLFDVNNQVRAVLEKRGARYLDTVKINNGFSTVAYLDMYKAMKINGTLIDFNYAVSTYNTGSYIIIGTPVIKETY